MKKILENVELISTRNEYDLLNAHIDNLLREATENGYLNDPAADNEYTRELGRLARLSEAYERQNIHFSFEEKSPLVQSIEAEMFKRGLKQKDAARLIGLNEPSFSAVIRGKRKISMPLAKRLYHKLNIDPKLIVEYA
jgi:antitoxin component HigA of HigAB toxin-antitoxin module